MKKWFMAVFMVLALATGSIAGGGNGGWVLPWVLPDGFQAADIAVDTNTGDIHIAGNNINKDSGAANFFLGTFSSEGTLDQWTSESINGWFSDGIAIANSDVYVAQNIYDAFDGSFVGGHVSKNCFSESCVPWRSQISKYTYVIDIAASNSSMATTDGAAIYAIDFSSVMKLDPLNGLTVWNETVDPLMQSSNRAIGADGAGNVYVIGETNGDLFGINKGNTDFFIAKISASGALLWGRQIGDSSFQWANDIAIDKEGNIYVSAQTGQTQWGGNGITMIAKFSSTGNILWKKELETNGWMLYGRWVTGMATDNTGVVILDNYGYLSKMDKSGGSVWMVHSGANWTNNSGIAIDPSTDTVFVAGSTNIIGRFDSVTGNPKNYQSRYEETDPTIRYDAGDWSDFKCQSGSGCSGGGIKYSTNIGSRLSFSFFGSQIKWVGAKGPQMGIVRIYIDSVYLKTVNLYSKTLSLETILDEELGLWNHAITIENSNQKDSFSSGYGVSLDYFETSGVY